MPKNKVVIVEFPFSESGEKKLRPALLLAGARGEFREVVVAFISSTVPSHPETTDLILETGDADFKKTGLKQRSVIRLHKLASLPERFLKRELGYLTPRLLVQVEDKLRRLFTLRDVSHPTSASPSPKK